MVFLEGAVFFLLVVVQMSCVRKTVEPNTGSILVELDGVSVEAHWDDGDTFSWTDDSGSKHKARLSGFNTLESYGAVHSWGDWDPNELADVASQATVAAKSSPWKCHRTGSGGGYGRVLVDCPDLKAHLLSTGLAHAFSMDGPAPSPDMALQIDAIGRGVGMWAEGVPTYRDDSGEMTRGGVVTSLHSLDERAGDTAYNRVCDVMTGYCPSIEHTVNYQSCEWICLQGACMLYVPYAHRYGQDRAACLR